MLAVYGGPGTCSAKAQARPTKAEFTITPDYRKLGEAG
jgi:hypothetical protein